MDPTVLKWFGHVERMDDGRFTNIIFSVEVLGAGGRGTHNRRQNEKVKRAC